MLMITTILMSQAWLRSYVLPFVLCLCLCSHVNQAVSIRTRSKRKQSMTSPLGLAKIKQEFFFVLSFVRLLAYAWTLISCLWLRWSLCRRVDLTPSFCLLFCPYAYAHVWTRFEAHSVKRGFNRNFVDEQFVRAKANKRDLLSQWIGKRKNWDRMPLVVNFNPALSGGLV